jgi:hypothetical protein
MGSTIKALTLMAAGQAATGQISVKVAALAEGVTTAMFVNKLTKAIAVLMVAVLGAGAIGLTHRTQAGGQTEAAKLEQQPQPEKGGFGKEQDTRALFNDLKERVKAKIEEMNQATWKREYAKVVDLTHPHLVEKEGGREKMMAMRKWVMDRTTGVALRSFKVAEPKVFLVTPKGLFVVVPTSTEVAIRGLGKTTTHDLFVGISWDNGKSWRLVHGNLTAIRKHLPDLLPEGINLPALHPAQLEPDVKINLAPVSFR